MQKFVRLREPRSIGSCSYLPYCLHYVSLSCHRNRVMTLCSAWNVVEIADVGVRATRTYPIVCTSILNTAGRSRTMGVQLSPASAEA